MKMGTIYLPIALLISLTLTLSTATNDCPGFISVPSLLSRYKLPLGIFPADVEKFECTPIEQDKLNLSITSSFQACYVTTTDFVADYSKTITATISANKLTNITGVKVSFTGNTSQLVQVTEVQAFFNVAYQFKSEQGYSPVYLSQNLEIPPACNNRLIPRVYGRPLLLDD